MNPANSRRSTITPETRVAELLKDHPGLEDLLVGAVPAFAKLRNPVLRKTVARVATLRQAAVVGKVDLGWLINTLRKQVGDSEEFESAGETVDPGPRPEWCDPGSPDATLDIRKMLESGQQPIGTALAELKELKAGEVLRVIAPFVPLPLIDKGSERGFDVWWRETAADRVEVFFRRPAG